MRPMLQGRLWFLVCAVSWVAGCGSSSTAASSDAGEDSSRDAAAVPDAAKDDGHAGDAHAGDGSASDGTVNDVAASDATIGDAPASDAPGEDGSIDDGPASDSPAGDARIDDAARDAPISDSGPVQSATHDCTPACGGSHFCEYPMGPGTCPSAQQDSGFCPPGCPGCARLPLPGCVALPVACAGTPSCDCLLSICPGGCGAAAPGTCAVDADGDWVIRCTSC